MRSVVLTLLLLVALGGANPPRLRGEKIVASSLSGNDTVRVPTVMNKSTKSVESPHDATSGTEERSTDAAAATTTSTPAIEEITAAQLSSVFETYPEEKTVEVCDETSAPGRSKIYCSGKLLAAVNHHHIFKDSKTFVDRPMKVNRTEVEIMSDFESHFPTDDIDPMQLRAFVEQNFEQEGHELEKCEVADWQSRPRAFEGIADERMKQFAHQLNDIWKDLCRKISPMVRDEPERFSLLYVPNNFIAPGGRFREFYYWDTYWIVKGLLASGMYDTTRGILENFGSIIARFGFIPNGGRVYYLKRSQPPLLTAMVYEYYEATRNKTFLMEMLPLLEKEHHFWQTSRHVSVEIEGVNHTMFQFRTEANVPRPESYREDSTIAAAFPSKGRQQAFYRDVGSAAESGWDFSTRWFADRKTLLSIHTTDIVQVDLNAFLCYNLNLLSFFHGELGNSKEERDWRKDYISFKASFREVFYKPEKKGWYDYDVKKRQHNFDFFPSIATPLFTGCFDQLSLTQSSDLLDKMEEMGAINLTGGIPTSLAYHSQEQWDFPNGWSPLNHMVIEGMRKSDNPRLQQAAFSLAQRWVRANYHVFKLDKAMWEKYNVVTNEARGGGGEYEVQAGFGWTNGVVLDLLVTYGDRLTANESSPDSTPTSSRLAATTAVPSSASASPMVSGSASSTTVLQLLLVLIVAALSWQ